MGSEMCIRDSPWQRTHSKVQVRRCGPTGDEGEQVISPETVVFGRVEGHSAAKPQNSWRRRMHICQRLQLSCLTVRWWISIRVWLQACEVVSGFREQDSVERTDHSRLRSAARRRWERVISAQSKGEHFPTAAKFRVGPCSRSKCSERNAVTPNDTCLLYTSDAADE